MDPVFRMPVHGLRPGTVEVNAVENSSTHIAIAEHTSKAEIGIGHQSHLDTGCINALDRFAKADVRRNDDIFPVLHNLLNGSGRTSHGRGSCFD